MNIKDYDIHTKKAAEMFTVPVTQVTPEQRKLGKMQNFLELYSRPLPLRFRPASGKE